MITRKEKEKIVEELRNRLGRQKILIVSNFHGTSVSKLQRLRRLLKINNAEYKVAKKTLIDRAIEKSGIGLKTKDLPGELGITFGYGDEISPAKILVKFSKENETFRIVAGILRGKILDAKHIIALAKLPGRDILFGQLARTLASPIQNLATVLQGNIKNLVVVINKIRENKFSV